MNCRYESIGIDVALSHACILLFSPSLSSGCSACSVDTNTYDRRDLSIPRRVTLGQMTSVTASGSLAESEMCSLENAELGLRWDCTGYRALPASITSLECVPAEACADIVLGDSATFVPCTSNSRFMPSQTLTVRASSDANR